MKSLFAFTLSLCLLSIAAGCDKQEQISSYSVDNSETVLAGNHVENEAPDAPSAPSAPEMKSPHGAPPVAGKPPAAAATAGETQRMFAAMLVRGEKTWYYKMTGPADAVEAASKELGEFVNSVKYEGDKAIWTLPKGWKEGTGNSMRYATLMVPSDAAALEFAISQFKTGGEDEVMFAAAIINRWRGQLGLKPIVSKDINAAGDDLSQETSKQKVGDQTIYFVNIVGKKKAGGMRPPFAQ